MRRNQSPPACFSTEREAQLNDYATRHGQDLATALDEVLSAALEWERLDHQQAVEGIAVGYADFEAGRVRPIEESFEELRVKHGLPRKQTAIWMQSSVGC